MNILKHKIICYNSMPKRIDKFNEQRNEVVNKLLNILGVNENNNKFYLYELDNNIDKQNAIYELVPDIKKYFICSKWTCFCKDNVKREYLSIIKYIMKDMDYNMISSRTCIKNDEGKFINVNLYHIIKK